jgi:hypothetical protein
MLRGSQRRFLIVIRLHDQRSFAPNTSSRTPQCGILQLLWIISLDGGWTADPEGNKPGRDLGIRATTR